MRTAKELDTCSGRLPHFGASSTIDPDAGQGTRIALLSGRSLVGSQQRLACDLGQFEADGPARFPLADSCSVDRVPVRRHVIHAERHEISATHFIDRKVEHGQVARAALQLQLCPDRPHVARSQCGFGPVSLPLFQAGRRGLAICDEGLLSFMVGLLFKRPPSLRWPAPAR